uniref:Envelope protein syncytin-Car1 n=2 Tax=Pelusios castaneus TaxID=367368 RepID=A0A8C8S7K0_9SAUR
MPVMFTLYFSILFLINFQVSLFRLPTAWKDNWFLNITRAAGQAVNQSDCWICAHSPPHAAHGIPLYGIPLPGNLSWSQLWKNTAFEETDRQAWEVFVPPTSYALCVQRSPRMHRPLNATSTSGFFVGNFSDCNVTHFVPTLSPYFNMSWSTPKEMGWYWLCNTTAYKSLPPTWFGRCTLGVLIPAITMHKNHELLPGLYNRPTRFKREDNPLVIRPSRFQSFVRWFIPWLGISELEKAIVNISATLEVMANATTDAITTLQSEVQQLSTVALQNRLALDYLLAAQGGVCATLNSTCCVFLDQTGRIETDVHVIQNKIRLLHQISTDDTSWGFKNLWDTLTSWLPNLGWLKHLFVICLTLLIFGFLFCCCLHCSAFLPTFLPRRPLRQQARLQLNKFQMRLIADRRFL